MTHKRSLCAQSGERMVVASALIFRNGAVALLLSRHENYDHFGTLAKNASGSYCRHWLQILADNYVTLAASIVILNRSAKLLDALEQRPKKT
jgi:hypothetical protein